jgi:hypothetical protein
MQAETEDWQERRQVTLEGSWEVISIKTKGDTSKTSQYLVLTA